MTVRNKREAAQGPLREGIEFGIDLIQYLEEEEEHLTEKAIQVGLDKVWEMRLVGIRRRIKKSEIS